MFCMLNMLMFVKYVLYAQYVYLLILFGLFTPVLSHWLYWTPVPDWILEHGIGEDSVVKQ